MRIITESLEMPICDVEGCEKRAITEFTAIPCTKKGKEQPKKAFSIAKVCEDNDHFIEIAKLRDSLVSEMEIKNAK